ncbi:MAG TPA: hypothetical protein VKY37_00635, partial [Brumimicrobium sp.]|nr:hypothetical protein [Brumimicrobium sp.]
LITCYKKPLNAKGLETIKYSNLRYTSYTLPAGTEDLHLEEDNKTLWTLTEFTPNEGCQNNRIVFAFSVEDLPNE